MESEQCLSLRKHILLLTLIPSTHLIHYHASFFFFFFTSSSITFQNTLHSFHCSTIQFFSLLKSFLHSNFLTFMALSLRHPPSSTVAIIFTVAFIFFLTVLPHKSSGAAVKGFDHEESRTKVIGSTPPACVNKCKKCRPCMATLVVPRPHQSNNNNKKGFSLQVLPPGDDDYPYYLLLWKCTCDHKLFQP